MAANETMIDSARSRRRKAAAFAAAAAILLIIATPLDLRSAQAEGVDIGDIASYPLGAAAVLALIGSWLALRSAGEVRRRGVDAVILVLALAFVIAVLGALAAFFSPAIYNAGHSACLAGGAQASLGASVVPGGCGDVIPDSDFPTFYPAALAGLVAAISAIVAVWLLVRAHVPREAAG